MLDLLFSRLKCVPLYLFRIAVCLKSHLFVVTSTVASLVHIIRRCATLHEAGTTGVLFLKKLRNGRYNAEPINTLEKVVIVVVVDRARARRHDVCIVYYRLM